MVPDGNVTSLRGRGRVDPAVRAVLRLVAEAGEALTAGSTGDLDAIFTAHRALTRAVGIVLDNHLSTAWCPTCGAAVSGGKCWGCGRVPGRAS